MSGKEAALRSARAWGAGLVLAPNKCLEAKWRDDRGFVFLAPSLAIFVGQVLLVLFFFVPEAEPAPCA